MLHLSIAFSLSDRCAYTIFIHLPLSPQFLPPHQKQNTHKQVYENQHEVGEGIQEALKQGIIKDLTEIYVVSKIWNTCHSAPLIRPAAERILRELNLPKINQLLIHWPCHFKYVDENTFWPKDEQGSHLYDLEGDSLAVWKEMEKLVDEGLVESIGLSNFNEKEVQEVIDIARIRPACVQVECHPVSLYTHTHK